MALLLGKYDLFNNNGFFSLVFNEFIIIYCCGLEYDTHLEIIKRANKRDTINDSSVNELEEDNKEDPNIF